MCEIRRGHPDARRSLIRPSSCFLLALGTLFTPLAFSDDPAVPPDLTVAQPVIPSAAELEAQRKALAENATLDEATRARIDELYGKAISRLAETSANDRLRQQLAAELEAASELLAEKQQELESFIPTQTETLIPEQADFDSVSQKLAEAQALVTSQRVALDGVAAEITRRLARRKLIPSLLSESQDGLETVDKELAAVAPADESAELTAARLMLLQIRKQFLQSQRLLCEQESQTYEPTQRLWTARRDLAERQLKDGERVVAALQNRLAQIRRKDASAAAREARMVAADAHPAVADMAARNAELAEESQVILRSLEQTRGDIVRATELRDALKQDFEHLQQRAEAAGFSRAIGVLLRNQKNKLPDTAPFFSRAQQRAQTIADVNVKLIEWESERNNLGDPEDALQRVLIPFAGTLTESEKEDVAEELATMLSQTKQLLSTAFEDGSQYLDRLVALDSLERELTQATHAQAAYIAEHVLWVRSAEPVRLSTLQNAWADGIRLFSLQTWRDAYRQLFSDAMGRPLAWSALCVLFVWVLVKRRRIRAAIRDEGVAAARSSATTIRPTVMAAANSATLAILFPGVMWFFGWAMALTDSSELLNASGNSLQSTAVIWFALELLRQLTRAGGVCEQHFGMSASSLRVVRRWLGITMALTIPACWILLMCEGQDSETLHGGLGRMAFVFATLVLTVVLFQLLRGSGVIVRDMSTRGAGTFLVHSRPVWATIVVATPAVLAATSLAGFHYSALQMSKRFLITLAILSGLAVIYMILNRWLLVAYRRIAINRNRQRRDALLREAAEQTGESVSAPAAEADAVPAVSLADVNQQTRKMIRLGTAVCAALGLWSVWIDVLPALGILRNVELWENQIAGAVDTGDGEAAPWVTLADLALAVIGGLVTIVAARNLPGLVEMTLLQKLPLDAAARYAASSITRYVIAVIGVTLSFWLIGVGWSSIQWLIAAMTVGLGFGLQEIFANFVSGLILLFEQPVRIGDTVTVSGITGTVSRIRIRATTIVDWDNKELIVPNRAFVTDNLVNWTLSSSDLRIILRVGIAYGSDTRKATELLKKIAHENANVLRDPLPVVSFYEFGESSLNFEMRIFVTGLYAYRNLQHELNLAIDDEFHKAGIEIAFPQRDLHLRSLPAGLVELPDHGAQSGPDNSAAGLAEK